MLPEIKKNEYMFLLASYECIYNGKPTYLVLLMDKFGFKREKSVWLITLFLF